VPTSPRLTPPSRTDGAYSIVAGSSPRSGGQFLLWKQAVLHREQCGDGPAGGAGLRVDVLDVVARGLRRDHQPRGDLLVGQATGEQDEHLCSRASGDVIVIGGGTGLNLPCYGPDVTSLTITEPEPPMLRHLERRAREHHPPARVLRALAEDLPFGDHTFDVAVSTLVLCAVDDQPRALRELRRVLRLGGRLLFLEHLRSGDPGTARLQDRINWLNRLLVCCDCNRPTLDTIRDVRPAILGSATTPVAAPSSYPEIPGCRDAPS
jgi:SAM-dependent methyltransferase